MRGKVKQFINRMAQSVLLRIGRAVTTVLIGFSFSTSSAAEMLFQFTSTPGSWVGHGYLTYAVTPDTGWSFTATTSADHSFVRLSTRSLDPSAPFDNYYWDLELESVNGNPLSPGFYPGATRWPFNSSSEPGMWLSGNHRGDNIISGYFTIHEVDFNMDGTLNHFAVDFRQYDEGNPENWVDGQWRFNATIIPEPSTLLVFAVGGLVFAALRVLPRHHPQAGETDRPRINVSTTGTTEEGL